MLRIDKQFNLFIVFIYLLKCPPPPIVCTTKDKSTQNFAMLGKIPASPPRSINCVFCLNKYSFIRVILRSKNALPSVFDSGRPSILNKGHQHPKKKETYITKDETYTFFPVQSEA